MADELQAAAERQTALERKLNGIASGIHHDDIYGEGDEDVCNAILADAYLTEHPADDGEAITADWLRSVGWKQWDTEAEQDEYHLFLPIGEFVGWKLRLAYGYGLTILRMHDNQRMVSESVELEAVTTRGQLRQLASALGIELGEKT